jgi:hypothetical protein
MKKKIFRIIACYLAFTLLFNYCWPVAAWALTSGPSQPEVQSFEPAGTTDMVDMFSGDFNYNIPLLTVPGPNGGYPINLAYHAGVTMEQEASWVGLGWNLNVGALNRSLRGLPDDFKGEKVKQTVSYKPNVTLGLAMSKRSVLSSNPKSTQGGYEILGQTEENLMIGSTVTSTNLKWGVSKGISFTFNNYRGIGIGLNFALSREKSETIQTYESEVKKWPFEILKHTLTSQNTNSSIAQLSLSLDPQNGAGLSPSYSAFSSRNFNYKSYSFGGGYSTRGGMYSLGLSYSQGNLKKHTITNSGLSFNNFSNISSAAISMNGLGFEFYDKSGIASPLGLNGSDLRVWGNWSDIANRVINQDAFGYLYTDSKSTADPKYSLLDFSRGVMSPLTSEAINLPVPQMSYDSYSASGQGMGMGFRAYRSDIGVVANANVSNNSVNVTVGLEKAAPSSATHIGVNVQAGYSRSYSGMWNNHWNDIKNDYDFQTFDQNQDVKYESFFFMSPGEMGAFDNETERFGTLEPQRFEINTAYAPESGSLSFKPKVHNRVSRTSQKYLEGNKRKARTHRTTSVEYRTLGEQDRANTKLAVNAIVPQTNLALLNAYPGRNSVNTTTVNYSQYLGGTYNAGSSQIGYYNVLGGDGMRYEYGLPVYNKVQKDVQFSVAQNSNTSLQNISYDPNDASTANDEGRENFYSATEIPAYAYTYLLTAVYSADYIDLTGDGPSEDDLGYYVKFNYSKTDDYNWRSPFIDAQYDQGNHSDAMDDKAGYSYGKREVYVLNSVETKTHIAEFYVSERKDARGAAGEHNNGPGQNPFTTLLGSKQFKLDRIELFSKSNRNTPIKKVLFDYDYSLCKKVVNNIETANLSYADLGTLNAPAESGKLTLKKVWFEYQGNGKGKLSPYKFYYREDNPQYNPDYNLMQMDRWGTYKPDAIINSSPNMNIDNPYTNQDDRNEADRRASVWNLHKITTPAGGVLTVNYEADDYGHVQDHRATQMMQIEGTGDQNDNAPGISKLYSLQNNSREVYERIYFKLERPTTNSDELNQYIDGMKLMYFKTYMKLKMKMDLSGYAYDYVDGFCEVEDIHFATDRLSDANGYHYAYVNIKPVPVRNSVGDAPTHPFSRAAWEYMRLKRPDLLFQDSPINHNQSVVQNISNQFANITTSYIRNLTQLILGYFTSCSTLNYASEINLNTGLHPSFIRLNSPDFKKVGGGHRVRSITMSDNWNELTSKDIQNRGSNEQPEATFDQYGTEYFYVDEQGRSTGVASYEPQVGQEENAMRLPTDRFSSQRSFLYNSEDLYMMEPIAENYYPSADVGYSKVIVRSLKQTDAQGNEINRKTSAGVNVVEFFTSKDFPVRFEKTEIDDAHYSPNITIPFVGSFDYDNHGYSQGYSVFLNDMHGKVKSTAAYPSGSGDVMRGDLPPAITKTEYNYQTQKPYSPHEPNRLNNVVNVLYGDADYRAAAIGTHVDFFMDMIQHSGFGIELGMGFNIDGTPPASIPTLYPMVDYSENMFRSIVAMKVIQQNGVLVNVKTTQEGSTSTAENLMFDAKTGQPLLTSLTNDFDKPIYSYNYPAHWNFDGMDAAAENYGAHIVSQVTTQNSGVYPVPSPHQAKTIFAIGDQVEVSTSAGNYFYAWVSQINATNNTITLIDEAGSAITTGTQTIDLKVVRSGRRNHVGVTTGGIVSLSNPVTNRRFALLDAFNTALNNTGTVPSSVTYLDCVTGQNVTANVTVANNGITFSIPDECSGSFSLPGILLTLNTGTIPQYRFYKQGNRIAVKETAQNGSTYYADWFSPENCFQECLDDVLHAETMVLKDNWDYDYTDVGNPNVQTRNQVGVIASPLLSAAATANPWRFGKQGIWHTWMSYAYQVDRKQAIPEASVTNVTNIKKDGVYEHFVLYNWLVNDFTFNNPHWTQTGEITKYSHFGFELENKNPLNQYSSALYGYNNSLVTSIIQNATYYEQAFDGFEDHNSTTLYDAVNGRGHLKMSNANSSQMQLYSSDRHTGKLSYRLTGTLQTQQIPVVTAAAGDPNRPAAVQTQYSLVAGKKYVVSAWYKSNGNSTPTITVVNGQNVSTQVMPQKIEGWQRIETTFTVPVSGNVQLQFYYTGTGTIHLIDDIRIQPFTSAQVTYVYDPVTLWLLAELDNRNFATFYNYDEEGALVQVKKETEKGIMTLQTSRNNMYHRTN